MILPKMDEEWKTLRSDSGPSGDLPVEKILWEFQERIMILCSSHRLKTWSTEYFVRVSTDENKEKC